MKYLTLVTLLLGCISLTYAEQYVFPANGQNNEQQQKDESSCHQWAVQETGFDPTKTAEPKSAEPKSGGHGPTPGAGLRGAAKGGLAGAVIADIGDNDSNHGAQKGAALGLIASRRKSAMANEQAAEQRHDAAEQQQAANASELENYYKASAACLEAKGYSVK